MIGERGRWPSRWRNDPPVEWFVGLGVLGAGIFDWLQGRPPDGPLPIPSTPGFLLFALSVAAVVALAAPAGAERVGSHWHYWALAAAALAAVIADPTYASLLFAAPLIDIRRRVSDPTGGLVTVGALALIAVLVLTEQTRRTVAEVEAILVLIIAMAIVVLFGNALRRVDRLRAVEAELARVDERNRLAQDLHDSLGHNLLACSIQLRSAEANQHRDPQAATRSMGLAGRAVADALADTRLAVDSIRADGAGFSLERSLHELVERAAPPSLTIDIDLRGDHRGVDHLTQITLYRVAQEALTNVVRHADAGVATIRSTVDQSTAILQITDDGNGFEAPESVTGGGLASMRERLARIGGRLDVETERGVGTTLTAVVAIA